MIYFSSVGNVDAGYIDRKAEGWHFYEPMAIPQEKSEQEEETVDSKAPEERLKAFKAEVERLKQVAVMEPTYENVKSYMTCSSDS